MKMEETRKCIKCGYENDFIYEKCAICDYDLYEMKTNLNKRMV